MRIGVYVIWLLWLAGVCCGAERVTLVSGPMEELPAAGMRLRPFKKLAVHPFPAVRAFTYQNSGSGERIEAYAPQDLWLEAQREALYSGEVGTLTVYTLRLAPPEGLRLINGKHVQRDEFVRALTGAEAVWTKTTISAWLEYLTGWTIAERMSSLDRRRLKYPLFACTFEGQTNRAMAAVVRLPLAGGGDRVVALVFEAAAGVEVRNMERAMGAMLASLKPDEKLADDRGPNRTFQNREVRGDVENRSAEYEAARQRVIANIRNLEDWWYVETANYVITSNLSRKDRKLVGLIQSDIEIVRKAYQVFMEPEVELKEVSVVRVFAERHEYEQYVGEGMEWSGGAWLPPRKELVISPVDRELSREVLLSTVYHEAFHQYVHYALDRRQLPVWFDEGHASFFSGAEVDRRKETIEVVENESYVPTIDEVAGQPADSLERLLSLSHAEFYGDNRHLNYTMGWALVYFLRKGCPVMKIDRYDGLCELVVAEAMAGRGSSREVAATLARSYDLEQLRRDFREFWDSRSARRRAERLRLFEEE